MNNAQAFVLTLVGTSITFKPIEKGKDRPVQTIHFGEMVDLPISSGGTVKAFKTTIIFSGKRGIIKRECEISVARALEYVAQAANATEVYDEVVYVAPVPVEKPVKEKKVKEKAEKPAKEPRKTKKQLAAEAAAAAEEEQFAEEAGGEEDPFAEEVYNDDPFAE